MTFTEAAVEVLRLAGKPLHYKKITEIAIERNLLSHVGKTPEITMSSRLATMIKKDRGDAPIIKVKPGVFGLRDFPEEVIKAAERESGHEFDLPETEEAEAKEPSEVRAATNGEAERARKAAHPGADMFPEEEDDDEPILGKLDEPEDEEDAEARRRGRRRRRRRGKRGEGETIEVRAPSPPVPRPAEIRPVASTPPTLTGDFERRPADGQLVGRELADAIEWVLGQGPRQPLVYSRIAEQLVRRGRLTGDASALAPTVAAAIRGDNARRSTDQKRPRFRAVPGGVALVDWYLPGDATRAEQDVWRAAERQRDAMRRAFLRKLAELPNTGFMEVIAAWLNAEGVGSLRGVRRPGAGPSEFHLAGTWRRGPEETALAIVLVRDDGQLGREHVIGVRGSLHHYGNASAAWLITTGRIQSGAREEAAVTGQSPCALYDGMLLASAMERAGIGLRQQLVPISTLDIDLFEAIGGVRPEARPVADVPPRPPARPVRPVAEVESDDDFDDELDGDLAEDEERAEEPARSEAASPRSAERPAEEGGGRRRRRRRRSRRGRDGEARREDSPNAAASGPGDEPTSEDGALEDEVGTADVVAARDSELDASEGLDDDEPILEATEFDDEEALDDLSEAEDLDDQEEVVAESEEPTEDEEESLAASAEEPGEPPAEELVETRPDADEALRTGRVQRRRRSEAPAARTGTDDAPAAQESEGGESTNVAKNGPPADES